MFCFMNILHICRRNMSTAIGVKLLSNAETAEYRLAELKTKLSEIRKAKIIEKIRDLTQENESLVVNVERAKVELIRLETLNGKKQYPLPGKTITASIVNTPEVNSEEPVVKKEKKETKKKEKVNAPAAPAANDIVDVRKLDFRIGKIIEINKHPDADSLYVEKIDCGEPNPRTIVSGLVNHVPIDEMRNKIVMVLCNLKPVKMRGISSEGMVMCASSPDKVEVLIPPSGATPGDLVSCEGFPREPEPVLNPKKKIFELCAPNLKTNNDKVACYKNSPLVVPGKGPIVAPTLTGVQVK